MAYSSGKNEQGFTIVELLAGLAIGMLLLSVAVTMLSTQMETFNEEEELSEMQQNIRVAMDMIVRETKMAGYDPAEKGFYGVSYDAGQLHIVADLDGNGVTNTVSLEDIKYKYYGNPDYNIKRKSGTGSFQPITENIADLTIVYLDELSQEITLGSDSDKIRQVWIKITGRTSNIDTRTGDFRYGTLTATITPRNLTYDEDD